MNLRLSQKLATKIKADKLTAAPLDANPFADWSTHLFAVDRTQYIIVSNTQSLYSCVLYGAGINDDGKFIERVLSTIREFMEADGRASIYNDFIAPASASVQFSKALNRTVTGSMNDLINHATTCLAGRDMSPHDVGFDLNDVFLSALGDGKARTYGTPNEAFQRLANVTATR